MKKKTVVAIIGGVLSSVGLISAACCYRRKHFQNKLEEVLDDQFSASELLDVVQPWARKAGFSVLVRDAAECYTPLEDWSEVDFDETYQIVRYDKEEREVVIGDTTTVLERRKQRLKESSKFDRDYEIQ